MRKMKKFSVNKVKTQQSMDSFKKDNLNVDYYE